MKTKKGMTACGPPAGERRMPPLNISVVLKGVAGVFCACALIFVIWRVTGYRARVDFYVFDTCGGCGVQNPCRPCTLFNKLDNELRLLIAGTGFRQRVDLSSYNIYFDGDRSRYRENMARLGIEEVPALPAIVVGNRILTGTETIEQGLAGVLKEEFAFPGIIFSAFGAGGREQFSTGVYEAMTVVMFTLPSCEDCRKATTLLENMEGITIIKVETSGADGRKLYERYCEAYGAPLEDYAVPRIFAGKSVFLGSGEVPAGAEQIRSRGFEGGVKTLRIELAQ